MARLPLFPLGTVLFPGLVLPLHVFEPRYRKLVADLKALPEGAPRRFGVVAIRQGNEVGPDSVPTLHDIGCTAMVSSVESREDGCFDLVTVGATRFAVRGLDDSGAYLQADVDWLLERPGGPAQEVGIAANRVAALFDRYRSAVVSEVDGTPPGDPRSLSYLVAAVMVLDLVEKQSLLSARTDLDRLRGAAALLRRETRMIELLHSLPAVDLPRAATTPN